MPLPQGLLARVSMSDHVSYLHSKRRLDGADDPAKLRIFREALSGGPLNTPHPPEVLARVVDRIPGSSLTRRAMAGCVPIVDTVSAPFVRAVRVEKTG